MVLGSKRRSLCRTQWWLADTGVVAVWNNRFGVLQFTLWIPHAARVANHRWHRSVDDDVAWHVQVGDAFVRVDHGQ